MTDHDDLYLLSGAYALNALDQSERDRFEDHLDGSEELRTEVVGLSETAVLLGLSARPVTPSPELKSALMDMLATTEQLPATTLAAAGSAAARPSDSQRASIDSIGRERPRQSETKAAARWFSRPVVGMLAAAAAVALIVGGVGGALLASDSELQNLQAAGDLRTAVTDVSGGGTATVLWSHDQHRSAVLVADLPELVDGKVYQLWYINDGGATPAGTIDASGTHLQTLDGSLDNADLVGITIEPEGGSESPTTEPIMTAEV